MRVVRPTASISVKRWPSDEADSVNLRQIVQRGREPGAGRAYTACRWMRGKGKACDRTTPQALLRSGVGARSQRGRFAADPRPKGFSESEWISNEPAPTLGPEQPSPDSTLGLLGGGLRRAWEAPVAVLYYPRPDVILITFLETGPLLLEARLLAAATCLALFALSL